MKRILSILIIILLVPMFVIAQETTSVKQTLPEVEQPESFFNDLIKVLTPSVDSTKKVPEKVLDELPAPTPLVLEENVESPSKDLIDTNKDQDIPLPEPVTPNEGVDLGTPAPFTVPQTVTPVPLPVSDDATENTPVQIPANTPQVAPQPVASPNIVIGTPESKKQKEKKEKVKKEREPKEYVPYIEVPDPKSKSQKKYVTMMEKAMKSRMRLITLDQADIIHGRKFRSAEYAIQNPANLGARSEFGNSFSIIPINTLDIDLKTSTRPFVFIEDYLSTGELLTPDEEDTMIAMLGPNGLELPLDISMPTVINLKMSVLGGSIFANAGLFIQERSRIPGEFFGIILDGATIDNPFQMNDSMGVNLNAYAKASAGYGTFVELPGVFGELRFGATVNAYTGAFTSINVTNLELVPSTEGVTVRGTLEAMGPLDTLSLFGSEGVQFSFVDDIMGIPGFSLGYDFGLAWRFKLNRILPLAPNFLKNYFDFQIGIEDLGAKITMNHAYMREINFEMVTDDLLSTFSGGINLDSMMVLEETLIYSDSTITRPLGTKLNMSLSYQPIPQLILKGGLTSFLSEGLNSNTGQNYFFGAEIYPISSLCLFGTVTQKGNYRYSEAGIKLLSEKTEFGLKLRVYNLDDFSLTENVSGAGLQLNWARYF
ncbi:MAG: DUF5723 family protein [Candidatus Marinimicrobia bacterium]|nr:DUF5723 family protein [Candidatus Neomarinimicrobiota bacterium]